MFGFARLAAYNYFEHLVRAFERRYRALGRPVEIRVVEAHPTASIRRRAEKLVRLLAHTAGTDNGPIHLLGHSTGGLDARLVASPSVQLTARAQQQIGWRDRLRSVTTMNTPHFGTPLATFFATAKGQRLLYAVSALTVGALKFGAPPLAAASALVAALGRTGESLGIELKVVDRITDSLSRAMDEASSRDLRDWLKLVRDDQGGVVQLMPEAMDLFQAGVENHPSLLYQCIASYAPATTVRELLGSLRSPWSAMSATLFRFMWRVTAVQDLRYPCAPLDGVDELLATLLDAPPSAEASDGVVPLSSQFWGTPIWVGLADHLDTVGHFRGPDGHNDWMASGAAFDLARFETIVDHIFEGMRQAET